MIVIKARSAKIVGIMLNMRFSVLLKHRRTTGFHVARTYECVKPREPRIFKIGYSPVRYLVPNHVNM